MADDGDEFVPAGLGLQDGEELASASASSGREHAAIRYAAGAPATAWTAALTRHPASPCNGKLLAISGNDRSDWAGG